MFYGDIKNLDVANGPGCRVSLFVSGCRNHCKGCFQPETWAFDYGKKFDADALQELLRLLENPHIAGLSILGGDPFEPENMGCVLAICKLVRERFGTNKSIWVWTGYDWESLCHYPVMHWIDVLVDGKFEESMKDLTLHYRGSQNQRVIDVAESNKHGCAIRWKGDGKWR